MSRKYFGTDGIRGLVGVSPITPDFVLSTDEILQFIKKINIADF